MDQIYCYYSYCYINKYEIKVCGLSVYRAIIAKTMDVMSRRTDATAIKKKKKKENRHVNTFKRTYTHWISDSVRAKATKRDAQAKWNGEKHERVYEFHLIFPFSTANNWIGKDKGRGKGKGKMTKASSLGTNWNVNNFPGRAPHFFVLVLRLSALLSRNKMVLHYVCSECTKKTMSFQFLSSVRWCVFFFSFIYLFSVIIKHSHT